MSLVQPQQQPQQQPIVVYPNTVTNRPPSHHSDGSFGAVFMVLAIIIVISAIACFLGRMCNKRLNKQKPKQAPDHNFGPKEADVEFGNHKKSRPKEGHIELGTHSKFRPKEGHVEFGNHSKPRSKEGHVEFGNNRSFRSKGGDIEFGKHSYGPKDKDVDIEFGLDKKIPSVKLNGNREHRGFKNGDEDRPKKTGA